MSSSVECVHCELFEKTLYNRELRIKNLEMKLDRAEQAKIWARDLNEDLRQKVRELNNKLAAKEICPTYATNNSEHTDNSVKTANDHDDDRESLQNLVEELQLKLTTYKQQMELADKTKTERLSKIREVQQELSNEKRSHRETKKRLEKVNTCLDMIESLSSES